MKKYFTFIADTINGEIQEFPVSFEMVCNQVTVIGMMIVRDYDDSVNFIIARQVLAIQYRQDVFGTTMFSSASSFYNWLEGQCNCCPSMCQVYFGSCPVVFKGCAIEVLRTPLYAN